VNSRQLLGIAEGIDQEHSDTMQRVIARLGLNAHEGAALSILLAGFIAGRAEVSIVSDPEAQQLYDRTRIMGRDRARAKPARSVQ